MSDGIKAVKLLVATTNLKKLRELHDLLFGLPIKLLSLRDFPGIEVVEETGKTFRENARLKALGYARQTGYLTLGEDSGLCCDALDGAPGVFSARFSGLEKNDEANNSKLLDLMRDVPDPERSAHYISVIALAEPDRIVGEVAGEVHGFIRREPRGTGGFGYDPLFYFPEFQQTFAEIPSEMKHTVSHRGQAFAKLLKVLEAYLK
jgi:XTP/dITP diphosphohydrolase